MIGNYEEMKQLFVMLTLVLTFEAWGQQGHSFGNFFDKFLKNFETEMDREMKRFENFFQHDSFGGIDKMSAFFGGAGVEPFWRETKEHRILIFKVESSNDGIPFNIKIKDGHITVKGTIQKQKKSVDTNTGTTSFSSNVYQFQHGPVPIPSDVDESGVKIEKKKGEILIFFPKKKATTAKPSQKRGKSLPRSKGDVTI